MALIGLSNDEYIEYVSKFDKDRTNPTIFLLGNIKALTNIDFSRLGEKVNYSVMVDVVKAGLKGIKNIYSKKEGKHIDIYDVDKCINMLPPKVIMELANEIVRINFLDEEEEKN